MLNKTLKLHEIQYGTGIEIGIRVQGNRNQSAEVNLVTVTSDKGAKTIQWRKISFQQMVLGEQYIHMQND